MCFMCVVVCVYALCSCLVPVEARRGCERPRSLIIGGYERLDLAARVLGSSREHQAPLTVETPVLCPPPFFVQGLSSLTLLVLE